jgi:hypothetical protein
MCEWYEKKIAVSQINRYLSMLLLEFILRSETHHDTPGV